MKKILLGLFLLITLGFINFSSAGTYTITGNKTITYNASTSTTVGTSNLFNIPIYSDLTSSIGSFSISCSISNLNNGGIVYTVDNSGHGISVPFYYLNSTSQTADNSVYSNSVFNNGNYVFNYNDSSAIYGQHIRFYAFYSRPISSNTTVSFDYSCTVSGDGIIDISCPTCPTIDQNYCTSNNLCPNTSCSPSGQCTVSDKVSENLLYTGSVSLNNSSYTNIFNYGTNGAGTYCVKLSSSSPQTLTFGFTNSSTGTPTNLYQLYNDQYGNWVCLYGNKAYFNAKLNSSSNTVSYEIYKLTDLLSDDVPCTESSIPECEDWTQLQCENEYDLIPESSITSEYCEDLFNLIDPENCPASGGTGDVNWSSFFVNSHQIQGANNVYLWLPDFLNWDYTYIDSGSTLEINVENQGDSDYIENMLAIQTYRPTSDEFALSFFGGLYLLFPYIFIVLLVLFIWRLIKRIFK